MSSSCGGCSRRGIEGRRSGYRGHEGLRRFAADLLEGFASPGRIDVTELRDLDDWVLMLGEYRNEGEASGATTAMRMGWLFEVRGGRIVRGRDFLDQQEALEAAERAAASF
jgi:ketosteroid isomerase-like protein